MADVDYTEIQLRAAENGPCQRCMMLGQDCGICRLRDTVTGDNPLHEQSRLKPQERERIEFIRRAAIAICAGDEDLAPLMAWSYAKALWEARPDDC